MQMGAAQKQAGKVQMAQGNTVQGAKNMQMGQAEMNMGNM